MMHQDDFTPSQFVERRGRTDDSTLLHIQEIHKEIKSLKRENIWTKATLQEAIEVSVKEVMTRAFPNGDPEGHKHHHELVIKREEERLEFWQSMRKEVGKWGLIGVLGFIIVSSWQAFLQGPHK